MPCEYILKEIFIFQGEFVDFTWTEEPGGLPSMESQTRTCLNDFTFTFNFHALEKALATHSSVLAWRIPGTGGAWWAAVYGVTQSRTRLKQLSCSSSKGVIWLLSCVSSLKSYL